MNPVLFKIGSVDIYTHGLFLVFAVSCESACLCFIAKKSGEDMAPVLDLVIYTTLFGIIGARMAYIIVYFNLLDSPLDALRIW